MAAQLTSEELEIGMLTLREERRVAAMPGVGPQPSQAWIYLAAYRARDAMVKRRGDGRPPPKTPFLDAVVNYDTAPAWIPRKRPAAKARELVPANPADMARSRAILGEREEAE